ncbi:hypothetical protein RRG08_011136 [Elysia crispata]|uniref:Uncharacterized protein n=1 Tax=Elysia crispata TaxID=231223 RepID=A0AAE1A255_9GAST|nr:hypothetical protein RRG08_011136 [Elysia crispata]
MTCSMTSPILYSEQAKSGSFGVGTKLISNTNPPHQNLQNAYTTGDCGPSSNNHSITRSGLKRSWRLPILGPVPA